MGRRKLTNLPAPIVYPRDAIVERAHVAAALLTSEDNVEAMDLPRFTAGKGGRSRYVWGQVLDELAFRADPDYEAKRKLLLTRRAS